MSEPIITGGEKKKGPVDAITVIAVVIVVAVIAINLVNKPAAPETSNGESQTETPNAETTSDENVPILSATLRTDWIAPEEFDQRATAENTINASQGKTAKLGNLESIVYGVIANPDDRNTVYFATTSNNARGNFVGIYQYNLQTHHWQRFYKNDYLPENGQNAKELHVIGKDGRKLIIAVSYMGDTHPTCSSPYLWGTEAPYELVTIDMDHPLDGFAPYTVSTALRAQQEGLVETCSSGT